MVPETNAGEDARTTAGLPPQHANNRLAGDPGLETGATSPAILIGRTFMELDEQIDRANRRAQELGASHLRAVSANYDSSKGQIVVCLSSRLDVAFSPRDAEGLEGATPAQLEPIEISPSGFDIHFPKLDADLYLPALLEGFLGSRKWMAGRLGATGGRSTSAAKASAARKNGRAGGRPRKATATAAAGGS
jgi:hypothetical protein